MKNFREYLTESKNTYEFRFKIADCDLTSDVMTQLEDALKAYELQSIAKTRRLPIQDHPLDFAGIGPCEVNIVDVVLDYPANDDQLRQLIHDRVGIPLAHILVVPRNHPEELRREEEAEEKKSDKKEAILTKDLEQVKQEKVYGDEYNKEMLKKVPTRKYEFAKTEKTNSDTTNDIPSGQKSPLGSHKPTFFNPKNLRK
jgi:hypothetical protein